MSELAIILLQFHQQNPRAIEYASESIRTQFNTNQIDHAYQELLEMKYVERDTLPNLSKGIIRPRFKITESGKNAQGIFGN